MIDDLIGKTGCIRLLREALHFGATVKDLIAERPLKVRDARTDRR
jgi:hypothetical protein